jgi:hypothetical protein
MKLSEMTPEQQAAKRKYDREAKQRSRAKEKQEREKLAIPNARDYVMPQSQQERLDEHIRLITKTIQAELNLETLLEPDAYIVTAVGCVSFGLENNFVQIVNDPEGMLVGGSWFPDAAVSEAIEHVHRFPHILQSTVFANLYNRFLQAVAKWAKKNEQYADREYIHELKQEMAGTYALRPLPEPPKPEPKIQEEPLPSTAEILERGRIKLLDQLQSQSESQSRVRDPNIAPDAQRYLEGL